MKQVKAVFIIVASVFLTITLAFSLFRCYRFQFAKRFQETYKLKHIVQTGPEKEALPTAYLAELLGLCSDRADSFFTFDEKKGRERLLKSAVIKQACVKKRSPDTVYVDYEVFKPIARIGDMHNLAVDEEGNLFPLEPFFAPKRLVSFYFHEESQSSFHLDKEKFSLALRFYAELKRQIDEQTVFLSIDVSQAFHRSFGKREIVLLVQDLSGKQYVRFTPDRFSEQIKHYLALRALLHTGSLVDKVIDLRVSKAAYVEDVSK